MADYDSVYIARFDATPVANSLNFIYPPESPVPPNYTANYTSIGTFAANEYITALGSASFTLKYMGHIDGGWIGYYEAPGWYFLLSNVDPTTLSLPMSYSSTPFTVCFLAGTLIATPNGEIAVECLRIGDPVSTSDGRTLPVRWVGRQTIVTVFADALRALPVRIAAGALGDGLPTRDLFVSPEHALLVGGVLAQAGALVNGSTVTRVVDLPERFTYFHVELEDHSLILAEGTPAETFVDNVTRRRFDNFAEYEALYGDGGTTIGEIGLPRVKSARQLPRAVRDCLAERQAALAGRRAAAAA
jgi:hypothetical protein